MKNLKYMLKYKFLLKQLVLRDIKIKYKRSYLGYLWTLLQPLMMMAVLTVVFSQMFKFQIENFPMYLICGQVMFNFYAEATNMAIDSIISNAGLIKQVYIPKYILPLSRVFSSLVNLGFSLIAVILVMIATNTEFRWTILLFPIPIIYLFFITLGVSLFLSAVAVYFRDVRYLYGIAIQILCYLTPLFYPIDILPAEIKTLLYFNPLFHIVTYFRKIVLYGTLPTFEDNLICIAFAFVSLVIGVKIFKKSQREFLLYI